MCHAAKPGERILGESWREKIDFRCLRIQSTHMFVSIQSSIFSRAMHLYGVVRPRTLHGFLSMSSMKYRPVSQLRPHSWMPYCFLHQSDRCLRCAYLYLSLYIYIRKRAVYNMWTIAFCTTRYDSAGSVTPGRGGVRRAAFPPSLPRYIYI